MELNKNNKHDEMYVKNLCASFQQAIIDILIKKTDGALKYSRKINLDIKNLIVAGGVAANKSINDAFELLCKKNNIRYLSPPIELCGDNAAMIGWTCLQRYKLGFKGNINFKPKSRWGLEELNNI